MSRNPSHATRGQRLLLRSALSLLAAAAFCAFVYVGDFAVFRLRGNPLGQVQVSSYMAATLKNDKTALYFEGSGTVPCARSLFPQSGWEPCWYLRRHSLRAEMP